jgi:hypothetical protein
MDGATFLLVDDVQADLCALEQLVRAEVPDCKVLTESDPRRPGIALREPQGREQSRTADWMAGRRIGWPEMPVARIPSGPGLRSPEFHDGAKVGSAFKGIPKSHSEVAAQI